MQLWPSLRFSQLQRLFFSAITVHVMGEALAEEARVGIRAARFRPLREHVAFPAVEAEWRYAS
jgi:hypothetical protein